VSAPHAAVRTIRLACTPGTWVVGVEDEIGLVTDDDAAAWAFAMACLADRAPARLLVSSGPEVLERVDALGLGRAEPEPAVALGEA
jgi:hypothetical protein